MRRATPLTDEEFREAVRDALDSLPPEIASKLTNVAVIVEDRHPSGRLHGPVRPEGRPAANHHLPRAPHRTPRASGRRSSTRSATTSARTRRPSRVGPVRQMMRGRAPARPVRWRRSSDWRSTSSSPPRRRCSAAARSPSATSRTSIPARSASATRARCRRSNEQAIRYALMIAAALECEVAPRSIFHRKNYFYPDLPKGYQISQYDVPIAVERPARRRPHPPRPPRGGRGEARSTSGEIGSDPRLGRLAGRLQPRRHAAGRDRHRARPALGRGGPRVGAAAPHHGPPARRLRREHGGGAPAGGRQRLDPPGRLRRARDEDRAQEHEQLPLPRARASRPSWRASASCSRRGGGRPGDAPLPPRGRLADARCARRSTRTTTATSPSPTSCRWSRPRRC